MILKTDEVGREIGMESSVSQSAPALHGADSHAEPSAAQRIFDAVQPFIFQQDEDEVRALIETALGVEK